MCQFCHQHGEGKKWYLEAKNYSDDLLHDVRRRAFIKRFMRDDAVREGAEGFARLNKAPAFIRGILGRMVTRKMKREHFGQVVPIEDIEKIFGFVNSIVRVSCVCRRLAEKKESRYCYGISIAPNGGEFARIAYEVSKDFQPGPDVPSAERLSREEALAAFRDHEKEGLCHTVWTFHTPFIGGICNCDRADCLAMQSTVTNGVPVMFRGESVAEVDANKCAGCRECMKACQFGALSFSASEKKAVVDPHWCYGCGICRSMCRREAIRLTDRRTVPAAAKLW
jgi:NAD-dependent dihydropyrimidine dehydrogenase PreA subunit